MGGESRIIKNIRRTRKNKRNKTTYFQSPCDTVTKKINQTLNNQFLRTQNKLLTCG